MRRTRVNRRDFIVVGGAAVGALGAAAGCTSHRFAEKVIARLADLTTGEPTPFSYPGEELAYLVDLGRAVADGAGPKQCWLPTAHSASTWVGPWTTRAGPPASSCPCHASVFDAADNGEVRERLASKGTAPHPAAAGRRYGVCRGYRARPGL
jgi:hypothetical protein